MSNSIKATTNNLVFSYLNILLLIVKNIAIIPFYLKFFDLGIIGLWIAASNVLTILSSIDLGLNIIFTQKLAITSIEHKKDMFVKIFSSGFLIFSIIAVVFLFLSVVYINFVSVIFKIPNGYEKDLLKSLFYTSIALSINILIQSFGSLFQAVKSTFGTGLSHLIANFLEISLLFIFLYNTKSLISIGSSILIASLFNFTAHVFLFKNFHKAFKLKQLSFEVRIVKVLFFSSVPLFFSRITRALINNSQATILSIFVNNQIAAIFEITVKLYKTALLFLAPLGSSVFSSIASSFSRAQTDLVTFANFIFKIKRLIFFFILLSICLFSYILVINYNFITIWSGKNSYGGGFLTLICFFSFFFQTIARFLTFILNSMGVISIISKFEVYEMSFRLLLLFVFVKYLGIYGIPLSEIVSTGFILLPKILLELNDKVKFNFDLKKYLANEFPFFLIPIISMCFTIFITIDLSSLISLLSTSIVFAICVFVALIYFSNTFRIVLKNFFRYKSISKAVLGK